MPPDIQKLIEQARADCKEQGAALKLAEGFAQVADFNGDGLDDYLVDDSALNCDPGPSLYCGSGGCSGALYLSDKAGRQREPVVSVLQYSMTIDRSGKLPALVVEGRGPKLTYRWTGKKMASSKR